MCRKENRVHWNGRYDSRIFALKIFGIMHHYKFKKAFKHIKTNMVNNITNLLNFYTHYELIMIANIKTT